MSKSENVESRPTSMFLTVDEADVQVDDVANPKPGKNPEGWVQNYYVNSVSDTHMVLYTAFGGGTVTRLKSDFTYARIKP